MAKMYMQSDNGGYGILINDTETKKWYYFGEYHLPVSLDADDDESNAQIIRDTIASGDMYDADDFVSDGEGGFEVEAYAGMSLDEIDSIENGNRDCDYTTWTEI